MVGDAGETHSLSAIFGGLATLLAALGLYGVMAYAVSRRTREIGIRVALGAQRGDIVRRILREAAVLVGIGLMVGLGLALAASQAVSSMLYGLKPRDPLTLAITAVILAAVGFAASFLPARRAMRVDPIVALRYE